MAKILTPEPFKNIFDEAEKKVNAMTMEELDRFIEFLEYALLDAKKKIAKLREGR